MPTLPASCPRHLPASWFLSHPMPTPTHMGTSTIIFLKSIPLSNQLSHHFFQKLRSQG